MHEKKISTNEDFLTGPVGQENSSIEKNSVEATPVQESVVVANSMTNEQIKVRSFDKNEMLHGMNKRKNYFKDNQTIDYQLEMAKDLLDNEAEEVRIMEELSYFLQGLSDEILFADFESISNEQVPGADEHFLVSLNQSGNIKKKFEELGYSVHEVSSVDGEIGFIAEGYSSKFVFLYAKEKSSKENSESSEDLEESEDQKNLSPENVGDFDKLDNKKELDKQEVEQLIDDILVLVKKEDQIVNEEKIIKQIIEKFHELKDKLVSMNKYGKFFKILESFDTAKKYSQTESLGQKSLDRLSTALARLDVELSKEENDQGFWETGMKDALR